MLRRLLERITTAEPEIIYESATPPPLPPEVNADLAPVPAAMTIDVDWSDFVQTTPDGPRERRHTPLTTAALMHLMRNPERKIDINRFITEG